MKRNLLITILILMLPISIFASPFGLEMGMTLEEITEACNGEEPHKIQDEIYLIKPEKSHPLFEEYAVYVNDKTGLYQIRAFSSSIESNKYGEEIKNAFSNLKDRIKKTYGIPEIIDTVDRNISSFYQTDEYWFKTLKEGSRKLYAIWGEKQSLKDNLVTITLECTADRGFLDGYGHITLYYYFSNNSSVEDEQDFVF